jgi:GTP cyclohydrolase I
VRAPRSPKGSAHIGYIAGDGSSASEADASRTLRPALHGAGAAREQIADGSFRAPRGIAVHLDASHLCTQMRGVEEHSRTVTTFWRGEFEDPELRREFLLEVRSHRHG